MSYKPSPKPDFLKSTIIQYSKIKVHRWGDKISGFVKDWIYVSNKSLHQIIFGLKGNSNFRHSNEFRTIFGADELMYVLEGVMIIVNPKSGEMHRVEKGQFVFFRKDTWHHAFNYSNKEMQVLEFFSPPPLLGTSGSYAKKKPFLKKSKYYQKSIFNPLSDIQKKNSFKIINSNEIRWGLIGDRQEQLIGTIVNTKNLKVYIIKILGTKSSCSISFINHSIFFSLNNNLKVSINDSKNKFAIKYKDSVYLKGMDRVRFFNESKIEATIIICEGINND